MTSAPDRHRGRPASAPPSSRRPTSRSASVACRPSATSTCASTSGRSSGSSAPTAPARPRCSTASPASTNRPSGRVRYRGQDVTDLEVHERADLGMGRTFQNVGLVKGSTVGENLKSAQHLEVRYGAFAGMFGSPKTYEVEQHTTERARAILDLIDSATCGTPGSRVCPTASRSGSRSPPCWPPTPTCCCSTSPARASAPRRPTPSATSSSRSARTSS